MRTLGRRDVASIIAAITCLASCGGLTACAEETPEPFLVGMPERAVGNSPMPERYADAFARYLVRELDDFGRKTERKPIPADRRIRQVRSGEITVSYGCTGELLEHLDRNRAMELRREYKKQKQSAQAERSESATETKSAEEWNSLVYDELLSALPSEVGATLPGQATPCPGDSLPQNAVVIYSKHIAGRKVRAQLNHVATATTMEMLGG